jgi:hypothetical protein
MHLRTDPPAGPIRPDPPPAPAGPPAVSVVLCTWNPRGDVLARVLAALAEQTLPGRRLRILVRTIVAWLGIKHRGPARALDLAYYRGFLAGAARGAGGLTPPGR